VFGGSDYSFATQHLLQSLLNTSDTNPTTKSLNMRSYISILLFVAIAMALPTALPASDRAVVRAEAAQGMRRTQHILSNTDAELDNDDYVVYPDLDADDAVVYAYQAINDK
jgi:hypothetical protein